MKAKDTVAEFKNRLLTVSLVIFLALIVALAGWSQLTASTFAAAPDEANTATFVIQPETDIAGSAAGLFGSDSDWATPGLDSADGLTGRGHQADDNPHTEKSGPFSWTGFTWAGFTSAG